MKIEAAMMAGDYTETGAAAKQLEDLGFNTAIAFEGPHDPFMGLVLAAQATEHIELATGVAITDAHTDPGKIRRPATPVLDPPD